MASIEDLLAIKDPVERVSACNTAIARAREFERDALALRNEAILDQMNDPDIGYGRAARASGVGRSTAANLAYQADKVKAKADEVRKRYKR